MLLRPNQPTRLAIGWETVTKPSIAFGADIALARSTSGAPVVPDLATTTCRDTSHRSRGSSQGHDQVEQGNAEAADDAGDRAGGRSSVSTRYPSPGPGNLLPWQARRPSRPSQGCRPVLSRRCRPPRRRRIPAGCGTPSAGAPSARSDRSSCNRRRAKAHWRWPAAGRRRSSAAARPPAATRPEIT